MADIPTPPASVPALADPTPPTESPRRAHTILGRLSQAVREQNWFAVVLEVLIVIVGVVIGFQVTGWGKARADRVSEQVYLAQLADDLRETERGAARNDSLNRRHGQAEAYLARAFYLAERPTADSLLAWYVLSSSFGTVRPVLGTVEALVATGDLALIENDSLRSAITAYLDRSRRDLSYADIAFEEWMRHERVVRRWFDRNDVYRAEVPSSVRDSLWQAAAVWAPPTDARDPFPFDAEAFLTDRDAAFAADRKNDSRGILRRVIGWMRRDAAALREQIEAQINR